MSDPAALGAFAVSADAAALDAFRAATGGGGAGEGGEGVPVTFPMRWLTLPEVRAAVMALLPEGGLVPVHEGQSFDYAEPLRAGVPYRMAVAGTRSREPDRLTLHATLTDEAGADVARFETVLRLLAVPAAPE